MWYALVALLNAKLQASTARRHSADRAFESNPNLDTVIRQDIIVD